jgi:anti-sigma factor RsiW
MSDEHISFDELAELAEGLLARRRARAVEAHLATCEYCQERVAALRDTTTALRGLGPVSTPDDVATRLDRALANAANAPASETIVPDIGAVRRRRLAPPSWAYAAAAAVLVIVGVSIVVASSGSNHNQPAALDSHGLAPLVATTAPQSVQTQESGRVYTPQTLIALAPGLLPSTTSSGATGSGSGAPFLPAQAAPSRSASKAAGSAPAAHPPAEGLLAEPNQQDATTRVPQPLQRYVNSSAALQACASFITDTPGAAPLAVDFARWSNPTTHARRVPALIMVFADPHDANQLDVYVVAAACNDSSLLDLQFVSNG